MPPKVESENTKQNSEGGAVLTNFVLNTKQFHPSEDDWEIFSEKLNHLLKIVKVKDAEKVSVLISVLSTPAYKLLRSLCTPNKPEEKSFDDLIKILGNHFVPAKNCWKQRKLFFEATKDIDESISNWHARILNLASECELGTEITKIVTLKFVTGTSGKIFESLSEQAGNSNLETLVAAALAKEAKLRHVESDATVNMVSPKSSGSSAHQQQQQQCTRCGKNSHNYKTCKYKNFKCNNCGKLGHLAGVCRNAKSSHQRVIRDGHKRPTTGPASHHNQSINFKKRENSLQEGVNSVKLHIIKNIKVESSNKPVIVSVKINKKNIEFELDSGAGISAITERTFFENFTEQKLNKSNEIKITGYTGNSLQSSGFFDVLVEYKNEKHNLRLFVIKEGINNILGRDLLHKFS